MARLLASVMAGPLLPGPGRAQTPLDQGIGGTGVAPNDDRGIGGTGVIGTIQGFGSIIVNNLRIAYPQDAVVTLDGAPAAIDALKLGHVVRLVAQPTSDGLSAGVIAVTSEVSGKITSLSRDRMVVLGQSVSLEGLAGPRPWRIGQRVAVSGLRRTDGVVVASRIDPAAPGQDRVTGTIAPAAGGGFRLGALRLRGAAPDLVGQRSVLTGQMRGGVFVVASAANETAPFRGLRASNFSIEAYVERKGQNLSTGSGPFVQKDIATDEFPDRAAVRAFLTGTVEPNGALIVKSIQANGRLPGRRGAEPGPGRTEAPASEHGVKPGFDNNIPRSNGGGLGGGTDAFRSRGGPAGGHRR
jgi:hypothetical protein